MQHAILYGEHELTIDEKNRLLVPSEIRKSIDSQEGESAVFIVIGKNRKVWVYPAKYYEQLVAQRQQQLTPDEDTLAFDQFHFARASKISLDGQGRILLQDRTLKRTNTDKAVTLIGARDHLEVWNRADWAAHMDELEAREQQASERARAASTQPR